MKSDNEIKMKLAINRAENFRLALRSYCAWLNDPDHESGWYYENKLMVILSDYGVSLLKHDGNLEGD